MAKIVPFPARASPVPAASLLSDAEARTAALDTRSSCIVEAPAGSGKTGLLVQRFLKLLADPDLTQPEEVLAMTFTRKATAEMHARVLAQLQAAHLDSPLQEPASDFDRETRTLARAALDRSSQLGFDLLAQPRRLNIRGFDSICIDLARALPLLSGGGQQQPIEDARPLYRQAARQTLLQLGGPDTTLSAALTTLLLHRDASLTDCQTLIAEMLQTREQWGELIPLDQTLDDTFLDTVVRPRLERSLEAIVCSTLQRAGDAMPPGVLEHLTAFAHRHAHLPGHKDAPSPIALCAGKHLPPEAVADHLDHWKALIHLVLKPSDGDWRVSLAITTFGFKPSKPELDEFKLFINSIQSDALQKALSDVLDLPSPVYPDAQWAVARALFHILRHALIELKLLFTARGQCDFSEFALNARTALLGDESATGLPLPAGGRLRHLLVDEMQDTSSGQYALIEALTQSWDGHSQTLFLVGDPKQSIYLFRQARVERFLRTMREQRLGDIRLSPLRLTANFRSQAALVNGFNDTFGGTANPIFPPPAQSSSDDVPFVAATPTRPETQTEAIGWHTTLFTNADPALSDYPAQEAREVRRLIQQRLDLPLPTGRSKPWRIAVLARARPHLDAIVMALKADPEIPFRGINLEPLAERPEILDLLALTRALLHPADRTAWLAVLHAPWCGLGRADLLALTATVPADATIPTLIASHQQELSPSGQDLLARAWPVLASALATLGRTSLAVHIERTWLSLGGDAWLAPDQRTNALRFFALLRELESPEAGPAGRIDPATLNARLHGLYAEPRTDGDIPGGIQVELTTIHNAKGLEWDVVLVPGLHRPTRPSGGVLLNWLELDAVGPNEEPAILLAPIFGKGAEPDPLYRWLNAIRSQREHAEEKRLFYVAATRAREELHLFAAATLTAKDELPAPRTGTLLKACWPTAAPHFNHAFAEHSLPQQPGAPFMAAPFADMSGKPQNFAHPERAGTPFMAAPFADMSGKPQNFAHPELAGAPFMAAPFADMSGKPQNFSQPELALAASAEPHAPTLQRLPLTFNPRARFAIDPTHRLRYTPSEALAHTPTFTRPEGGFAARAFGNVVHRYLQLLAARLSTGLSPDQLLTELPTWPARLEASLRGEGLSPTLAKRDAAQALRALENTLTDPLGRWLLAPHPEAASERDLHLPTGATLRVDRTFRAAETPLTPGNTTLWIVDFKTTDQGSRSDAAFRSAELAKYSPQLEAYAIQLRALQSTGPEPATPIHLGLYYSLIPTLIHWTSEAEPHPQL